MQVLALCFHELLVLKIGSSFYENRIVGCESRIMGAENPDSGVLQTERKLIVGS